MKIFVSILLLLFPFCLLAQPLNEIQAKRITNESVFQNPSFAACHASTIVELQKGKFMAAWFAGSAEGKNDVGIWVSTNFNGTWSKPKEVVSSLVNDTLKIPCWNPVLFKAKNGKLFLFYKQGKNPREWRGMVITSENDGVIWSKPQKLPNGYLGPIKNKPMQLKSGAILCPSSTESLDQKDWRVHLEITDQNLKSWNKVVIDSTAKFGVIQPAIIIHPKGRLQMLCRSRENVIVESWSDDNGELWSSLKETKLLNPNSGIDAVTLKNGLHVLVYNPLQSGENWWLGRNVLKVAVSYDGIDWQNIYTLEDKKEGEFSYPAIIQSADGLLHITYTENRTKIKYVVLKLK